MFDLRRRGKVGKLGMVGVNGTKFPAIRKLTYPDYREQSPFAYLSVKGSISTKISRWHTTTWTRRSTHTRPMM
jgi:hypothetical protein